jgi:group I intron endonuclease
MNYETNLLDARFKNISGVYAIVNTQTGQAQIGYAKNLWARCQTHRSSLRGSYHANIHLQRSWVKYGETTFRFILVEETSQLREREKFWIAALNTQSSEKGFNMTPGGDGCPQLSEEAQRTRRESCRKAALTPEGRERARNAQLKRWAQVGAREEQSERMKGNTYGIGNKSTFGKHWTCPQLSERNIRSRWVNDGTKERFVQNWDGFLKDGWVLGRLYHRRNKIINLFTP